MYMSYHQEMLLFQFDPKFEFLSVHIFCANSSHVIVGFLRVLQFIPTSQKCVCSLWHTDLVDLHPIQDVIQGVPGIGFRFTVTQENSYPVHC